MNGKKQQQKKKTTVQINRTKHIFYKKYSSKNIKLLEHK